jgi:hypothetical protein
MATITPTSHPALYRALYLVYVYGPGCRNVADDQPFTIDASRWNVAECERIFAEMTPEQLEGAAAADPETMDRLPVDVRQAVDGFLDAFAEGEA